MNTSRLGVGIDVLPLDSQGRTKSIGHQLAARDQPADLLFTEVKVLGGLADRVELGLVGLRVSVHRPDPFREGN